jgi:F-type H+-transporting ATPase subunit delta
MTAESAVLPASDAAVSDEALEIARRYAVALVGAAEKEGQVDALLDEFGEIERDVLVRFPRFAAILASPRVAHGDKDRTLVETLGSHASSLALRFLRVLSRHGRFELLGLVLREAKASWDRKNKRVPVHVQTAAPIDGAQMEALRDRLARLTAATPTLHVTIEPELIGGLVVQVGDHRYDASVKSRLEQIRQRLIEEKTHEIQSRRDQFSHPA